MTGGGIGKGGAGPGGVDCGARDFGHLLRISTDRRSFWKNRNWKRQTQLSKRALADVRCQFRQDPAPRPGPAFPSVGDATSSQKRRESFSRVNDEE